MPPKAKFEKSEIVSAALEIVKREGADALTARSLAEKLKSSPRPIFTVFKSMAEVFEEVEKAARGIYENMVEEGLKEKPAFKGVGKAYIRFAATEPKLFQLLFMREKQSVPDADGVLGSIDGEYARILNSVRESYNLPLDISKQLYMHLWIYSHGIAVLIATKVCSFTAEEISDMLTEVCKSLLTKIFTENKL